MATASVLKCRGLYTSDNTLSSVPPGALTKADNLVISHAGLAESRGGHVPTTTVVGGTPDRALAMMPYGDNVVVQFGANSLGYTNAYAFGLTQYSGVYLPPGSVFNSYNRRIRGAQAKENFYFVTSTGVKALEAINGTPAAAGTPRALDALMIGGDSGTNPWLLTGYKVAYRTVIAKFDAHKRLLMGEPSGRTLWNNTTGLTLSPGLVIPFPEGVTSSNFIRVYRSLAVPNTQDPSDELFLTREEACVGTDTKALPIGSMTRVAGTVTVTVANDYRVNTQVSIYPGETNFPPSQQVVTSATPTSFTVLWAGANASNTAIQNVKAVGYLMSTFTGTTADITPESMLGSPLYINAETGDTAKQGNRQPPLSFDLTWWNERMWYANTIGKHLFFLDLLGVGTPSGVQAADTINIAGRTYTARASPTLNGEFQVSASGSPAIAVEETAKSLVRTINIDFDNTSVYAYYISNPNKTPGKIVIEERGVGGTAFSVYASRPASWSPVLTTGVTGAKASTNDASPNRLYYSKLGEPEAVPLLNYIEVGEKTAEIRRVMPCRGRLYVFKSDGIYTVSADLRATLFDSTAVLVAADTVAPLANQLFCMTTQGVVAVSDGGVRIVSKPVENDVMIVAAQYPDLFEIAYPFAVASEADRRYMLWTPSSTSVTVPDQAFVYDSLLDAWTRWPVSRACGLVHPKINYLLMGDGESNGLLRASKDGYFEGAYDGSFTVSITAVSGKNLTLASTTGIAVGDAIDQGPDKRAIVTSVNSATSVTMNASVSYAITFATVWIGIPCEIQWVPNPADGPSHTKHFREATVHFKHFRAHVANATIETDNSFDVETVPIGDVGYGLQAYGAAAYGQTTGHRNRRKVTPRNKQRGTEIQVGATIREAFSNWAIAGYSVEFEPVDTRSGK